MHHHNESCAKSVRGTIVALTDDNGDPIIAGMKVAQS